MSTKVKIEPGICGLTTHVEAISADGQTVHLEVQSRCDAITKMFNQIGTDFDSFDLCLVKPGKGPLYAYAAEKFPVHCACPSIAGITKAVEVEAKLALKKDSSIIFEG